MSKTYIQRRKLVSTLLTQFPRCQAHIEGTCTGSSDDVHELLPRSAGGSILDRDNCICVCRLCHGWIHNHTVEAMKLGLLKTRFIS
jgi:hypothetical protein